MARKPRSLVLFDNCTTHKVWRAHNKEYYLQNSKIKQLYIDSLLKVQKADQKDYELNALTLMSNHVHEVIKISTVKSFSNLMRNHHSNFGLIFNKMHKRCGKVAQERPHTTCFEVDSYSMEAVFYTHANPIKAGMVKDSKMYYWSTHAVYAFGKKPKWLEGIKFKFPEWYMELGSTFKERQAKYRSLFNKYLKKALDGKTYLRFSKMNFHGGPMWTFTKDQIIKSYFQNLRELKTNSS